MTAKGAGDSKTGSGTTRRGFLQMGGLGLGSLGLWRPGWDTPAGVVQQSDRAVILLLLVGGPSQLETWDPKPDAPAAIRGPLRSIATRCPGVRISEHLPRMAARLDRLALVRSVHHDAAPIHETGHQLLQTGRLCRAGEEHPHVGSVVTSLKGAKGGLPPFTVLPGPIQRTGVDIPHGQSAGWLGPACAPFQLGTDPAAVDFDPRSAWDRARSFLDDAARHDPTSALALARLSEPLFSGPARNAFDLEKECAEVRDAYGRTTFGQSCLLARRLVEAGGRVVTVNMFETVFNRTTWDCHGAAPFSTLDDYANVLLPTFDRAFAALIDDLELRGRLETTLVVAAGEFGRTPRLNSTGGRDHWPGVWSVALAGGGVRGGQVVGSSDAQAGSPTERPVTPQDLLATVYHSLGIDAAQYLTRPDGRSSALVEDGKPIRELFG
ncbi:MAG: DUF1501 domain-containing protein [Isosphaerales bacterium]